MNAARATLAPGRWHFQHGPIDLVIGADGAPGAVDVAVESAWARFEQVLPELVAELDVLRRPVDLRAGERGITDGGSDGGSGGHVARDPRGDCPLRGAVARRMWFACAALARDTFITPMAAVAGSVAQEIAGHFDRPGIARAWVNNGGDIALHLAHGERLSVAVCADPRLRDRQAIARDALVVREADAVRGIATSGWRGRSLSLGIADAVTVLASSAALADAAATLVANAVNVEHEAVRRMPANLVRDDSDLGARAVTVDVGPLPGSCVEQALDAGVRCARALHHSGLIAQAMLSLQGRSRILAARPAGEPGAIRFNSPALQS